MMKKRLNIDNYFDKAKKQEVLFKKEDARNLVENHTAGFSNFAFKKSKGVKKMNIIGASIVGAALLGVLTFNSNDSVEQNEAIQKNNYTEQTMQYSQKSEDRHTIAEPVIDDAQIIAATTNDDKKEESESLKNKMVFLNNIDVSGVKLIRLNKEEIEKLGIEVYENNSYEFTIPAKKFNIKYRLNLDKNNNDIQHIQNDSIFGFPPILITKKYGEEIFARFGFDDNPMNIILSRKFIHSDKDEFDSSIINKIIAQMRGRDTAFVNNNFEKKRMVITHNVNEMINSDEMDTVLNSDINNLINMAIQQFSTDSVNNTNNNHEVLKQIENIYDKNIRINKLLPLAYEKDGAIQLIFWFDPNVELIKNLPSKYHSELINQFNLINTGDYCETIIAGEDAYFDILKSCDGSLKNLSVYPNPTDGALNIKFEMEESRQINIAIHDVSGEKIREFSAKKNYGAGIVEEMFDISDLSAGLYVISVTGNSGEQIIQRVIKR